MMDVHDRLGAIHVKDGGGFKHFFGIFTPTCGEMIQFDKYF